MGIYLPNMEMPKGGYRTVEIAFDSDGHPMALADGGDVFDVIPVPPHGRLIDADALDADLERQDMHTGEWDAVGFSIEEIENAPTIIPAEPLNEEVNE